MALLFLGFAGVVAAGAAGYRLLTSTPEAHKTNAPLTSEALLVDGNTATNPSAEHINEVGENVPVAASSTTPASTSSDDGASGESNTIVLDSRVPSSIVHKFLQKTTKNGLQGDCIEYLKTLKIPPHIHHIKIDGWTFSINNNKNVYLKKSYKDGTLKKILIKSDVTSFDSI